MKNVFICGCGDIGNRVALRWRQKGALVFGLTRSMGLPVNNDRQKHSEANPIEMIRGDLDNPESLRQLVVRDTILYHFAPPPPTGEKDTRIENLLQVAQPPLNLPSKVVLISTTAVYGDCQGQWVTEETPLAPATDRGKRRLHSEQTLIQWAAETGVPYIILRVPGIYGPGRLPLERIQKALPVLNESESPYTNRIHADDLANICVIAAESPLSNKIYNVSDGHPSTMTRYFKTIADAYNLPHPPEITLHAAQQVMSAGMLSYLQESRRIDNKKLLKELGITLQYPELSASALLGTNE